jgi:hypothetical protein
MTQSSNAIASAEMDRACLINGDHRETATMTFSRQAGRYEIGDAASVIA